MPPKFLIITTEIQYVSTTKFAQDVSLMKEFFDLKCRYEDMSPVLIPAGYTRDYIDGKISAGAQLKDVNAAFQVQLRHLLQDDECSHLILTCRF